MAEPNGITVSVVTPDGVVYEQRNAQLLSVQSRGGQMGIMENHVPVIASLEISGLKVQFSNRTDSIAIGGGFVEFSNNTATIVANTAERKSKIDVSRAQQEKARATNNIKNAQQKHNKNLLAEAKDSLQKANNRLQVAQNQN